MAEKSKKVSPNPFMRKSEIADNSMKFRSFSRGGCSGHKIKTEMPYDSKNSVDISASDAVRKTYFGKCFEDQQVKLKLLELTPKNLAMEKSEEVQEFIKQVSAFTEKKNPFRDKVGHFFGRIEKNTDSVNPVELITINENSQNNQKFQILKQATLGRNNEVASEDDEKHLKKLKWYPERILQEKKNRSGISVRKKDEKDKKNPKKLPPKNKKNILFKRVINLNKNPIFLYENERLNHVSHGNEKKIVETSTNKQNQTKKKKRSEIPLRKNRKPISTLLQKPLENVESTLSIDLYPKNKSSSPVGELSLCSEIQVIINAVGCSEKSSESGELGSDSELGKKNNSEEYCLTKKKINKCFKIPNIISDSNSSSAKLSEALSSADKKVKLLELEKVKTASFTVLRSNTDVLNRLESLHKRNISTKEEKIAAKTPSKHKISNPKNSFSSLKEKGSKKNLSYRLNSKGNKPTLKIKGKKSKKETEEALYLPKKHTRTKNKTNLDICNEIIASENAYLVAQSCEFDDLKNEIFEVNQSKERANRESDSNIPVRYKKKKLIKKLEDKLIPRRIQKEKEELKTCSIQSLISSKTNNEDLSKSEKLGPMKTSVFTKKSERASQRNKNPDEKKNELIFGLKYHKTMPRPPPPTPNICHSILETIGFEKNQTEDDEISSKTIILDNKFNVENNSLWCSSEDETKIKSTKAKSNIDKKECESRESPEITKVKKLSLVIKGKSLNFEKDEPPEKPESSDSPKIKVQLRIDLSCQNKIKTPEESIQNLETFNGLFMNNKKCNRELVHQRKDWKNSANDETSKRKTKPKNFDVMESTASELTDEKVRNTTFDPVFRKPCKCCSSLKRRTQHKTSSISIKEARKKKLRSDTEDIPLPSSGGFFNSDVSLRNEIKVGSKLKSGFNGGKQKDLFEDVTLVKLRRRNSEPHSFKEFVWKRTDFANHKGVRLSASSLASSLRHLNTDDIDDFIFWEPVPQKMPSCWEASLYHFKKPWTVLSCSVFKDNRQSKTPGLILENLRNGENLNIRQSLKNLNERTKCHQENSFDVEPSIAQKNIDIRNWLAALNFPTPPSTSSDVISEGHFFMQSASDSPNLNKIEACSKRRKVLPNIKFSDEISEKGIERKEKFRTSTGWEADEAEHLMELIRRKSGGYVTNVQFLNSNFSVPSPKVTDHFSVYSKLAEANNGNTITPEPKELESLEAPSRSDVLISETIISTETNSVRRNHSVGRDEIKDDLSEAGQKERNFCGKNSLRLKLKLLASEAKAWKFLVIFTLLIAIVHYSFLSSSWHILKSSDN